MNVAVVSNVVYPFVKGGAEKRIHEIGSRLVGRGHQVTVYGRQFWDGPAEIEHEGMTLRGVAPACELYTDDRRSITEAIGFATRVLRPLSQHAATHDVVVASVFPYFPVFAAKGASVLNGTPLVTTWHEVWGSYWEEYLDSLAPFGKTVERLAARVPQYPIAVSGVTADRLAGLGLAHETISVVPNGIDVNWISSLEPAPDGFDVLFAGRLAEHKNVDVLLRAFDRAAETATLGIVGDGPEAARLETFASDLECSDRVTFLGFLDDHEDVLARMRAARVFASPSTREGFGITFAEAMAADCTVIAAAHPESAAGEVVGDGGFVVEPSIEGVSEALERALEGERPPGDPTAVARRYDWDRVTERAERVYQKAAVEQFLA
jgi:glycosyltransferase involved in cell wall biosynthesis